MTIKHYIMPTSLIIKGGTHKNFSAFENSFVDKFFLLYTNL